MTLFYVLAFTILGIALLFVGYILGARNEGKKQDYNMSVFGKVERWDINRVSQWRGIEVVGTFRENGTEKGISTFLPDTMLREIKKYLEANKC